MMLRFLWSHGPQRVKYVLLVVALAAGLSRDFVMIVINKAAAAPLGEAMSTWLPLFVLAFIVVVGSAFIYDVMSTAVTTHVINSVRLKVIGGLLKMQPNFIERHQHGALYHILTTDVSIVAGFTNTVLSLLPSFIFLSIAIPQLFYYSSIAGISAVIVMIGGVLAYHLQQKAMSALNTDARTLDVGYFELVSDMLRGIRELRLHQGRRDSLAADVRQVLTKLRHILIKANRIYATGEGAVHSLRFMLFAGIVFLVPFLGHTEATVTFQVLTLVLFSLTPFEQIVTSYPSVIGTLVSYVRIADLNAQLAQFEHLKDAIDGEPAGFRKIMLRGITAVHASREQSPFVLGPLDFELNRGELVFLIGPNGSGKTTFMNLLAGLLDPSEGTIEVDGATVGPDNLSEYRARFSAIFTQYHVFRKLYGLEATQPNTAASVLERSRLAGITSIENQSITRLDLSAGQKRRLALAILLLEDRDIIMLDEFVAEQDPENREYFFKSLLPWLKWRGKTVVVSTHDLNWLDSCDRLLKFEHGQLTVLRDSPLPIRSAAE
ncbi:MAG TPA: ATP-binding cassette domain-containing protein [Aestuariivirgaceae bacterium]